MRYDGANRVVREMDVVFCYENHQVWNPTEDVDWHIKNAKCTCIRVGNGCVMNDFIRLED